MIKSVISVNTTIKVENSSDLLPIIRKKAGEALHKREQNS